ncbi:hypothetical protein [Nocardia salmonicida]|uniref:hypothetical protein n=1 Tax=Nocardia salmonicida TaxID=53431 RepID=UPI0007A4C01A|nr:hypothetical protein [Nocardia salmonicida]
MAHARTVLRIEQHGPAPFGLAVIAGNRDSDLLGWVHGRRTSSGWTAQRVAGALDLLGVTVPDISELVAAGFTDDGTDSGTATAYAAPAAPSGVAAMPSLLPASGTHTAGGSSRPPRPRRPAPRRRGRTMALGGLGIGAAVVGASALGLVVLAGLTIGGASSTDPSTTEPAPVPAGTSWTATEFVPPPAPTPVVPPTACYPFQPNC